MTAKLWFRGGGGPQSAAIDTDRNCAAAFGAGANTHYLVRLVRLDQAKAAQVNADAGFQKLIGGKG